MELIWQGIVQAFWLIVRGDPEVMAITWLSVKLSGIATASSLALGIPLGTLIGLARFPARDLPVAKVTPWPGCCWCR